MYQNQNLPTAFRLYPFRYEISSKSADGQTLLTSLMFILLCIFCKELSL